MNRYFFSLLFGGASLLTFAACSGSGTSGKTDTTEVYQFPIAPAPVDTADMVQPLPADSQHLKMPVKQMPDTGGMPVKEPEAGVAPK